MFDLNAILWSLCKERIRVQSRRSHSPPKLKQIDQLMPPRSRWHRPHISIRSKVSEIDCLYQSVRYLRQRNKIEDQGWISRQDEMFDAITTRINSDRITINSPDIYCEPKDPSDPNSYRLIANYDLIDKIIINQCNKYLLKLLDHRFLPCSYAHRSVVDGRMPTQHDAFNGIVKYWKNRTDIWVAECDIAGFYDNLSHQVVMDEYDKIVPEHADPRARKILKAYLDSYSFYDYALNEVKDQDPDIEIKTHRDKIEKYYESWDGSRIGIPQGGSLSGLIANIVMHRADQTVPTSSDLACFRYVDDMILIGDKDKVCEALKTYCNTLESLKLPFHPFEDVSVYGKHVWDFKSKNPYRWGHPPEPDATNIVPWIGFVGYQLRYDGQARIRRSSLDKELSKQISETDTFLKYVSKATTNGESSTTIMSMYGRLKRHLEAMAVGRRDEFDFEWKEPRKCWAAGFRGFDSADLPPDQIHLGRQLKQLDKGRGHQLSRAWRAVCRMLEGVPKSPKQSNRKKMQRRRKYTGRPWSYYGQFEIVKRSSKPGVKRPQ